MKNSKKYIAQVELEALMLNFDKEVSMTGVTFANVIYKNDYSKSKTIAKQKQLQKITEVRITVGSDYAKKVNKVNVVKQGAEESNFVAQKMNGKSYTNGMSNPVVHADKNPTNRMLVMMIENGVKHNTTYLHNNEVVTMKQAEEMDLLTPAHYKPNAVVVGRGLIAEENAFKINTLGFDKIVQITLNKVDYIVIR
jgi:hypothetical protein